MMRTAVVFALLLAGSSAEGNDAGSRFDDRFNIAIGGLNADVDGAFSSTRESLPVDKLTFDDLGMDDSGTVLWGRFAWRFADRWRLSASYSRYGASGFESASEDGNFEDIEWEIGAALSSDFDLDLVIAEIDWDLIQTERARLGIGFGVHAADLDFSMAADVRVDVDGGTAGGTEVRSDRADFLAPLPNFSVVGEYALTDSIMVIATAGYFSLSIDKYDGELVSLRGGVEWRPWRRVGFGLGYQYIDIDVTVEGTSKTDVYELDMQGPILFVSLGF